MTSLKPGTIKQHAIALLGALSVVFCFFCIGYYLLNKASLGSEARLSAFYEKFPFKDYYYAFQGGNDEPLHALRATLETGDIALFGSSELTSNKSRFTPYVFMKQNLGMNVRAFGHAGFQEKAIITELMSVINPTVLQNGRVVILISPSWFLSGSRMHEGLWRKEVASPVILSRVLDNQYLPTTLKKDVIDDHFRAKVLGHLDHALAILNDWFFLQRKTNNTVSSLGLISSPDWKSWKLEAQQFEKSLCSNNLGINDEYFEIHIKPLVGSSKFPLKISVTGTMESNEELVDFRRMLKVLRLFERKPLFVILPLSDKAYSNLAQLNPIVQYLEDEIVEGGYPLLNMWKTPLEDGVLTDVMHTGAYGWLLINEFMYGQFKS